MPPDTPDPTPPDPLAAHPSPASPPAGAFGPQFDPTDPAELAAFAGELSQRTGRPFVVPDPFAWPDDPDGTTWRTYPEHPCVRHYHRATRTVVDVSFPGGDTFRLSGWTGTRVGGCLRPFKRTGRYHLCGPAAIGWVLSRLVEAELSGDPTEGTP